MYSPHNEAPGDEVGDFYNCLRSVLNQIPLHNFVIVTGYFNARMGTEDVIFSSHGNANCNCEKLTDLMDEFNLYSSNNSFMKSKCHLWTFEYPYGEDAQLYYFI